MRVSCPALPLIALLDPALLNRIRCGICAVGYLTLPADEFRKDPSRPFFKIVGTGFLVQPKLAMTNRHVIEGLREAQRSFGFPNEQMLLMFVYPYEGGWYTGYSTVLAHGAARERDLDIGLIDFNRVPAPEFEQCQPLPVTDDPVVRVSEAIAVCGYPYGSELLERDGRTYRFGPVLQQGYISAVAPFDSASKASELLMDIRIAGGMSGSPVVRISDGQVVGIARAAWEATTGIAVPLNSSILKLALTLHAERAREAAMKKEKEGSAATAASP